MNAELSPGGTRELKAEEKLESEIGGENSECGADSVDFDPVRNLLRTQSAVNKK